MTARITFPAHKNAAGLPLVINRVNAVRVQSSWKEFTSRAEILLPRNVRLFDRHKVREIFRKDDPVIIELGYDGKLVKEFEGYIASTSADIPILIKCEDEMMKLRRIPVNYSAKSVTLDGLLKAICPGYEIDALEGLQLGTVRLPKTNVGKVLAKLQSDWKLFSYMRGKTLVSGKYYAEHSAEQPTSLHMERQLVSCNLQYRNKEDIIVKLKAVTTDSKGQKLEFEIGEDGGDTMELSYYGITAKADLEKQTRMDYERIKSDGFTGSVTAFGRPVLHHGQKVALRSDIYPDRNGTYYVDAVEKSFSPDGYRQIVTIGNKA